MAPVVLKRCLRGTSRWREQRAKNRVRKPDNSVVICFMYWASTITSFEWEILQLLKKRNLKITFNILPLGFNNDLHKNLVDENQVFRVFWKFLRIIVHGIVQYPKHKQHCDQLLSKSRVRKKTAFSWWNDTFSARKWNRHTLKLMLVFYSTALALTILRFSWCKFSMSPYTLLILFLF